MESFEAFDVDVITRRRLLGALGVRSFRAAHLRADARGVWLDDDCAIAIVDVRRAYFMPRPRTREAPAVVVESARGAIEIHVKDEARGRALLSAIGFGAAQTALRFEKVFAEEDGRRLVLSKPFAVTLFIAGTVAVAALLLGMALLAIPIVLGAIVLGIVGHARGRARIGDIVVGADGMSFPRLVGARFVAWSEIVSCLAQASGASITLARGERLTLRFRRDDEAVAFVERLRHALDEYRRGPLSTDASARLARGARSGDEWLRDLRAIGLGGDVAYRGEAVPVDRLWQVVEDPAAPRSARAGAAFALGTALDASGRSRLRVAAEACASHELRVAFDVAADAARDDGAIARALDACDEDDRASPSAVRVERASAISAGGSPSASAPRSRR